MTVYQISKEKHENKWKEEKKSFFEEMEKKESSKDEIQDIFIKCNKHKFLWKYNHLVGFIRLFYNQKKLDIEFEIYVNNSRVFFNRINKMRFEKTRGPNLHINIKGKGNDVIREKINCKFTYIKESFFKKNNYIDKEAFNNICTCLYLDKIEDKFNNI